MGQNLKILCGQLNCLVSVALKMTTASSRNVGKFTKHVVHSESSFVSMQRATESDVTCIQVYTCTYTTSFVSNIHVALFSQIITQRTCAKGKIIGCVVASTKITISRDVGV